MDTPGATWKRHGRTWGGMCGPKAGYPYYLGPKVLKRHGYTHHRHGPLSCVRCILPARKTETQGKLKKLLVSGSVYICALIMMAVQQTCRPQWVMLAACLAWVTTLSSRSGVKALSPHPTFDKLNVFLHPSLYVDVERLGDGVESHWWITRAKKAPWPPVLRDSTRKPHFPDLNLLVLDLILPSPELWEMGFSCLESTLFMAFFVKNNSNSLRKHPT